MQFPEELGREKIDKLLKGSVVTPDDGRKFTELYNVQHLQSAQLDRVCRVCISTIQRLCSMLRWFVFAFLKMYTARCEQYEGTGIALRTWHKARHSGDWSGNERAEVLHHCRVPVYSVK